MTRGGDSCSLPQEKQKPEFLKSIPEKMKIYSEFLGKRPWFAGDKVKAQGGEEALPFSSGVKFQSAHP